MREVAVLSPDEVEIIREAANDPNVFTDYFFRPQGETRGWLFDENFEPEGKWQKTVHSATQTDITVIGGFGTGKTLGVAMSACVWATLTEDFKFLNVAQKQWQAKQMYDLVLLQARNCRFDDLIWERPRKPHAKIIIKFKIGSKTYESSLEFMSVDKDATGILSWEGDWINIDEAGLLDNLDEVIANVGSRLRGRVRGRDRLGRFSMTSNSWDNFYLWYYFDQAVSDPENFLSIVVATRQNKNVTDAQFNRMTTRIAPDERERLLEGTRPEGKGIYYKRESIYSCEDPYAGDIVAAAMAAQQPGYIIHRLHGAGIIYYQMPATSGNLYFLIGDPGVDGPPRRNSPVLIVFDVTKFPRSPANVVCFWWGNGGGQIGPFVEKLFGLSEMYKPVKIYVDSTGPQKNITYLINEHLFRKRFALAGDDEYYPMESGFYSPLGLVRGVSGLDFSGSHKNVYLQASRLMIEHQMLRWPKAIAGIRSQLANYDPLRDKKIAQDIVACMAMGAHAIRGYFHVDPQALAAQANQEAPEDTDEMRRASNAARSRRSARAHPTQQYPTQH